MQLGEALELAAAQRSDAHDRHVVAHTNMFIEVTEETFWTKPDQIRDQLQGYAVQAQELLRDAGQRMQERIRTEFDNDEDLLTRHAARMRTAAANVVLLRFGLLPALKLDPDNPKLRTLALHTFAFLNAEIEATRFAIL